jgi:hypothetical protein
MVRAAGVWENKESKKERKKERKKIAASSCQVAVSVCLSCLSLVLTGQDRLGLGSGLG